MNKVFVLGAPDPEMAAIERLALDAGFRVIHATSGGRRVNASNAYVADPVDAGPGNPTVLVVECRPQEVVGAGYIVRIDHHGPGDYGYGVDPSSFLGASSLGQVLRQLVKDSFPVEYQRSLYLFYKYIDEYWQSVYYDAPLGWVIRASSDIEFDNGKYHKYFPVEQEHVLCAAADHCLEAAYRGRCPGVDPDELMRWRAESRAAFQKRPVEAVLADIEAAIDALRQAPKVILAGVEVADFGSTTVPELPEAAARVGMPFLATTVAPDGRRKVGLMAAPPEVIRAWMEAAPSNGLVDVYGDPARGFAGGYLP